MSSAHASKPQRDPDAPLTEEEKQEELKSELSLESDSQVFNFIENIAQFAIMAKLFKSQNNLEAFRVFKDASELKILDREGIIENHREAKNVIDREVEKKFSDRDLKSRLKKGEITQARYHEILAGRFKDASDKGFRLKTGIGRGKNAEYLTGDEYIRFSQAHEVAEIVHERVGGIASTKQYSSVISSFGFDPTQAKDEADRKRRLDEKKAFDEKYQKWQTSNPKGTFDDFMRKVGLEHVKKETVYGKEKGRKFDKNEEYASYRQSARTAAEYELRGYYADSRRSEYSKSLKSTSVMLNKTIDVIIDPKQDILTSEKIEQIKTSLKNKGVEVGPEVKPAETPVVVSATPEELINRASQEPDQQHLQTQPAFNSPTTPPAQPSPVTSRPPVMSDPTQLNAVSQTTKGGFREKLENFRSNLPNRIKSIPGQLRRNTPSIPGIPSGLPDFSNLISRLSNLLSGLRNIINPSGLGRGLANTAASGIQSALKAGLNAGGKLGGALFKRGLQVAGKGILTALAPYAVPIAVGVVVVVIIAGFIFMPALNLLSSKANDSIVLTLDSAGYYSDKIDWKEFKAFFLKNDRGISWNTFKTSLTPVKEMLGNNLKH